MLFYNFSSTNVKSYFEKNESLFQAINLNHKIHLVNNSHFSDGNPIVSCIYCFL